MRSIGVDGGDGYDLGGVILQVVDRHIYVSSVAGCSPTVFNDEVSTARTWDYGCGVRIGGDVFVADVADDMHFVATDRGVNEEEARRKVLNETVSVGGVLESLRRVEAENHSVIGSQRHLNHGDGDVFTEQAPKVVDTSGRIRRRTGICERGQAVGKGDAGNAKSICLRCIGGAAGFRRRIARAAVDVFVFRWFGLREGRVVVPGFFQGKFVTMP